MDVTMLQVIKIWNLKKKQCLVAGSWGKNEAGMEKCKKWLHILFKFPCLIRFPSTKSCFFDPKCQTLTPKYLFDWVKSTKGESIRRKEYKPKSIFVLVLMQRKWLSKT